MRMEEEESVFGFGEGCTVHGDGHLRECTMCGTEFCAKCLPRSTVCPDCADIEPDEDAEETEGDEEIEARLKKADDLPEEDLPEDEDREDAAP